MLDEQIITDYMDKCREERINSLELSSSVKELLSKVSDLKAKISELEAKQAKIVSEINNALLSEKDIVQAVYAYVVINERPTNRIVNIFSIDHGEYHRIGNIRLKAVYDYAYTDIVGLTEEQFEKLNNLIAEQSEKARLINEELYEKSVIIQQIKLIKR